MRLRREQTATSYNAAFLSDVKTPTNLWKLPKLTQAPLHYSFPHVYIMEQILLTLNELQTLS